MKLLDSHTNHKTIFGNNIMKQNPNYFVLLFMT